MANRFYIIQAKICVIHIGMFRKDGSASSFNHVPSLFVSIVYLVLIESFFQFLVNLNKNIPETAMILICFFSVRFETRLLHPGAETTDILTQYVSAIRALRVLDSSGVILENVCEPVKAYLR